VTATSPRPLGLPPREPEGNRPDVEAAKAEPLPLAFLPEPAPGPECCVSYAWGDDSAEGREREEIVDRLCAAATGRGINIIRDKTTLGVGDRISQFMQRIGRGGRVLVILSDKYLTSPYCMYELYEVWRNCRQDDEEFLRHVKVFTLPDTEIRTVADRLRCAGHWRQQCTEIEALLKEHGYDALGPTDAKRYWLMKQFSNHVGEILAIVTDILQPRDFAELEKYGFADLPDEGPKRND
jgi:internalin A